MNFLVEQLIKSAILSAIIAIIAVMQTKHKDKIMLFYNLTKKNAYL